MAVSVYAIPLEYKMFYEFQASNCTFEFGDDKTDYESATSPVLSAELSLVNLVTCQFHTDISIVAFQQINH